MSDNPVETSNYLRFLAVFIDIATETVLKVFYKYQPKPSVYAFFTTNQARGILKNVLYKQMYYIVTKPTVNPDKFDISLLITLLGNLFTNKLDPPKGGWGFKPAPTDTNIADDLERLRWMRNKIVAHRHEAKLPTEDFEKLFQKLKVVLTRLIREVEPASENSLTEKIDSYKTMTLDPSQKEKWFGKLQEWHDDLQQKVQEVLTKAEEFHMFFENNQEKYARYLQLLVDGGPLVLTAYLNELLKEQKKTVDGILIDNRSALQEELSNPEMIKQLYPTSEEDTITTNIDTKSWDPCVLAKVILIAFGKFIRRPDRDAIKSITRARECYAASAIESLDRDRFSHCCEDLVSSIRTLSGSVGEEIYSRCQKIIERYRSQKEDITDIAEYNEQLECHHLGIASLADKYKECIRKLRDAILDTEGSGVYFKCEQVLNVNISLLCEDAEKRNEAETRLFAFIEAALKHSGKKLDSQEISGMQDIFECLENIPTVKLIGVKKRCVILSIKCQSKEGLLALIDYIDGPLFQQHLAVVSDQFEAMYSQVFSLQGHFTLESLHKVHPDNFKPQQDGGIVLPIACSSPEETERLDIAAVPEKVPVYQEESVYERKMKYSKMRSTLKIPPAITQLEHYLESQSLYAGDSISELFLQEGKDLCLEYEEVLEKENAKYTRQLQAYQEEQARQTILIQTLREEVTQFMEKAENLEVALTELKTRYNETKRREDTEKELNSELKNQLNQVRALQDEISALNRENIDYETELEDAARTISTVKQENSTMKLLLDQFGGEPIATQSDSAKLLRDVKELQAQLVQAKNQYIERENDMLARLAESEEARLNAARQATRKEYSYTMKDHLERIKLEEQIEHSEKERQVLEHRLKEATEENINMSTKMIEMKIKISEIQDQYSEWVSKSLPREAAYKREIHDLKEDLAAEMRLRNEFFQRNVRISEEIRAIRKKLDIVDEEQTMARRNLEIDLENIHQRKSPTRPHLWRWNQTILRTGRNEMKTYKQSPFLIPRKKLDQI